ncbi:thioredoxin domain-containing protein [Specibacter sp. AOP5-B1-6]|uniref:thioredoxin domain-containing protein n=1 Tax=Specibacter sp. AOP5-B1-6 TaxID=3457653 RepID=UPI00402BA6AA
MNRLAGEPSAYLRQHAQNPVNWQPFDAAAFAESAARDAPIFLSVGYAACHWCHVMAGESFEDPAVAAYLNEHFVSIKVDREERPDVDDAYMAATQALSGEGGWPMSVFLTPGGKAFYAGTYFPPVPGSGRPSFTQVLAAVHEAWTERRDQVETTAESLAETLAQPLWKVHSGTVDQTPTRAASVGKAPAARDPGVPRAAEVPAAVEPAVAPVPEWSTATEMAVAAMARAEDLVHGGFGAAPKFPPTPGLEFLVRHAASAAASDAPADRHAAHSGSVARDLAGRALGAMVHSAVIDQLGGGFARYSVTADWSEPHYEKMLYDNAGLLQALVHWIKLAGGDPLGRHPDGGNPLSGRPDVGPPGHTHLGPAQPHGGVLPLDAADARHAALATISWLMDEMRLPGGAFASSLDADTVLDGVHYEGASYKWSMAELLAAASATMAGEQADVGGPGASRQQETLEPDALEPEAQELADEIAVAMGVARGEGAESSGSHPLHPGRPLSARERSQWERIKPAMLSMRAARVMPARDDKVVASWNGMLMAALAEAAMVLEVPACLAAAVELGEYLQRVHWDGQLFRVSHDGRARGIKGLLEDYAACANGYLTLYAATGEQRWFEFAGQLVQALERDFIADGVVFNHGAHDGSGGPLQGSRFADPFDNATASGVALMAGAFTSWAAYTGSHRHREMAESLLAGAPELARRAPRSAGGLLAVVEALAAGPLETAVVGTDGPEREELLRVAWHSGSPGMAIAVWDGAGAAPVPLMEGRSAQAAPLAYVCRSMVCARPVAKPGELRELLR